VAHLATHASAIAGVQAMHEQHGILVESLSAIRQQLKCGQSGSKLTEQIARLIEFTHMHFGCEESLLIRCAFPGLDEHRKAHRRLIIQMKLAEHGAEHGDRVELERVLSAVRGQYLEHVEGLDQVYSDWLNAHGID